MSVIIYGRRAYGRVSAHEGEYAHTQFAHLDFVPLFPIASFWITEDRGNGELIGFPIRLHGKSVAATYLRIWGAPLAFALLVPGLAFQLAGVALAALVVWSWTWRSLRGEAARRRSDFNCAAFGHRCEPALLGRDVRAAQVERLRAAYAKRSETRPPDDVARLGARDAEEAVLAYGLLRMAGVEDRASDAAADRILGSAFDVVEVEGGPYREHVGTHGGEFGAAILELAAARNAQRRAARGQRLASLPKRWFQRPRVQLVMLLLATPMMLGGVVASVISLQTPRDVTAKQLGSIQPPTGRVAVRCDRIEDDGWEVMNGDSVDRRVAFCWIGDKMLPIVSAADEPLPAEKTAVRLVGYVRFPIEGSRHTDPWVRRLHGDLALDVRSFEVYLDRGGSELLAMVVVAIVFGGGGATLWVLWLRAWRRRRRARRAAQVEL